MAADWHPGSGAWVESGIDNPKAEDPTAYIEVLLYSTAPGELSSCAVAACVAATCQLPYLRRHGHSTSHCSPAVTGLCQPVGVRPLPPTPAKTRQAPSLTTHWCRQGAIWPPPIAQLSAPIYSVACAILTPTHSKRPPPQISPSTHPYSVSFIVIVIAITIAIATSTTPALLKRRTHAHLCASLRSRQPPRRHGREATPAAAPPSC